ncbi:MAG: hypothetical protein R3B70_01245 [Polyangiaceae bacterium]
MLAGPPPARELSASPAPALTPTAEMPPVAQKESGVVPTLREAPIVPIPRGTGISAPASARESKPPPTLRMRTVRTTALIAIAVVLFAIGLGFVGGRFVMRPRGAQFAISGALPKRTEVLLDGKKLTFADSTPMPVPPGNHTLSLHSPKSKREIPFFVRPGETVVIVAPQRGSSSPDDDFP